MFVATAYAQSEEPAAHGETHSATEAGHGGTEAGFPPFETEYFPSQLLWLAITFGLFYVFLKKVVLPRLGGIIEVRRDRIAGDLDQAARLKQEADAAIAAYEQGLAEARKTSNQIGQQARDAAKAEAEIERKKIEGALDAKLADAEARITSIKAAAMKDVGVIAEETAVSIVETLVGAKADKASVSAAVRTATR